MTFARTASAQAGAENSDNCQRVFREVLLKSCVFSLIESRDLDIFRLANSQPEFRAKARQSVLTSRRRPPDPTLRDVVEQASQAFLVAVHAGAKIGDRLKFPSLASAI